MNSQIENIRFLLENQAALSILPLILPETLSLESEARDQRITKDNIDTAKNLPVYITNFIGSKQKLTDWIWLNTAEDVKSVLDAFSGSAVVGYMYKQKGLKVICNDRLQYCYHIARAIVENQKVTLSEDDLEMLLKENPKAGSFVQDTFRGKFFQTGVHALIDNIRSNIDNLSGYKKDIALFALAKTCTSASGSFGHFQSSNNSGFKDHSTHTPRKFLESFQKNVERINGLIFDNEQDNKAYRKDILDVLDEAKVDLAYFDPPYATQFSTTNYETSYHFVEGLMTYWQGLEIDQGSKVKKFHTDHKTVTQGNADEFFNNMLEKAKGIKYWIISYRDKAFPNERKMKELIGKQGKESRMKSRDHQYHLGGTNRGGDPSHGKEHLFICGPGSKKSTADIEDENAIESDPLISVADAFCKPSIIVFSNSEGIDEEMTAEAAEDTAYDEQHETTRDSLKYGADDFWSKNINKNSESIESKITRLVVDPGRTTKSTKSMEEIEAELKKLASLDVTVLLLGETGTGKSYYAEQIHKMSKRKAKKFIAINCATLKGDFFVSEIFGHEKGSFSGADKKRPGAAKAAAGGTLFLDEIGDLDSECQAIINDIIICSIRIESLFQSTEVPEFIIGFIPFRELTFNCSDQG